MNVCWIGHHIQHQLVHIFIAFIDEDERLFHRALRASWRQMTCTAVDCTSRYKHRCRPPHWLWWHLKPVGQLYFVLEEAWSPAAVGTQQRESIECALILMKNILYVHLIKQLQRQHQMKLNKTALKSFFFWTNEFSFGATCLISRQTFSRKCWFNWNPVWLVHMKVSITFPKKKVSFGAGWSEGGTTTLQANTRQQQSVWLWF